MTIHYKLVNFYYKLCQLAWQTGEKHWSYGNHMDNYEIINPEWVIIKLHNFLMSLLTAYLIIYYNLQPKVVLYWRHFVRCYFENVYKI